MLIMIFISHWVRRPWVRSRRSWKVSLNTSSFLFYGAQVSDVLKYYACDLWQQVHSSATRQCDVLFYVVDFKSTQRLPSICHPLDFLEGDDLAFKLTKKWSSWAGASSLSNHRYSLRWACCILLTKLSAQFVTQFYRYSLFSRSTSAP